VTVNHPVFGTEDGRITRRMWLLLCASEKTPWWLAVEAVSSVALEHPEWDMDERRTPADWAATR